MAQKRSGRGRPRKSPRAATGFPVTRRKRAGPVKRGPSPPVAAAAAASNEPTSAFEALCQVTSAEYERLSNNTTNCDNRSDSSSKSTEENRQLLSTPSDIQLPAWYGAHIAPSKPYKSELILPPKKKKYLHYLAEADDDNQIINNPFPRQETRRTSSEESATPPADSSTTPSPNLPASSSSSPYGVVPQAFSSGGSPEQLAPLKFNPTPVAPSPVRCPDTKTFNDVLDEHISRLIIQNDVIVSKQPAVVMSKRGRSREMGGVEPESARTPVNHSESMVKTLLSSKITRKTMLKENAIGRQSVRPSGSSFSYLNPENSAIKDLLIKTYEEKGLSTGLLPSQSTACETARESPDYTATSARQFKTPSQTAILSSRTGPGPAAAGGIVYRVTSDQRSGALVVPDLRDCTTAAAVSGWTVSPGMEWVTIDERGRRRVRPEVTVYPETASYQAVAPSPGRSLRSPSLDSVQSSEGTPSSVSVTDSRRVQSSGTFQFQARRSLGDLEAKMPPPAALVNGIPVRTAGVFHPSSQLSEGRVYSQDLNMEVVPESHEKTLNALRGHLTGRRPVEDLFTTPKSDEASLAGLAPAAPERSSLPPKKRKSFHVEHLVASSSALPIAEPVLALEPISPASPLDESRAKRQSAAQESGFSSYGTYVSENHNASHLGFYSDLSRQYSTNVAFAQTLLQQGHNYPSFRYSCVTTNSIRGGRPIHVPNGEAVSMYANWSPQPSLLNPNLRVDSTQYGKKKTDGSFYSSASKRSVNICATSVETYTRKRQLILSGMNSFLPSEAARLSQADLPVARTAPQYEEGPSTSGERFSGLRVLPDATGRVMEGIKLEDVSEDEEDEKAACSDCGRSFPKATLRVAADSKLTCSNCLMAGRSRAETFPNQARPTPQSRRRSDAVPRRDSKSSDHEKKSYSEKPLMAQLKQKIIGHQQPGPSTSSTVGMRSETAAPIQQRGAVPPPLPETGGTSPQMQDAMDLSVKKLPEIPDWRTMEGSLNRFPCQHCPKVFNKEGQLYLHSRVHEMETTGKADRKAKIARNERCSSPGSLSATNENPRPFFCAECSVGFRIHGHLQKHLRSKGHITQLECLNRLPCGFYAELERQNMIAKLHNIIDTADCAKAFSCLTQLAKTVVIGMPVGDDQTTPSVVPA